MSAERLRRALQRQLELYAPRDAHERASLERMRQLATTPAPLSRSTFSPGHFTVSALVLSPARDALLVVLHKKLGLWLQPGGHLDPSDTDMLAAARREVREEAGLGRLEPLFGGHIFHLDIHDIPAHGSEPAHQHFDVRYAFRALDDALTGAAEEVDNACWVALDQLDQLATDASVRRAAAMLRVKASA